MTIIKLDGKEHRKGTSRKTGNEYDFYVLHFIAPQAGVEGKAAVQKLVDPSLIAYEKLLPGMHYELDTDLNGNVIRVTQAKS